MKNVSRAFFHSIVKIRVLFYAFFIYLGTKMIMPEFLGQKKRNYTMNMVIAARSAADMLSLTTVMIMRPSSLQYYQSNEHNATDRQRKETIHRDEPAKGY